MNELDFQLRALFRQAQQGDSRAYQDFLQQAARFIRGYLMKTLGQSQRKPEHIEDLVQETLLTIHRKRDLYDSSLAILPWIQTITHHRWIDQWRSEKNQRSEVEWLPEMSETKAESMSSALNPEEAIFEKDLQKGNTAQIESWLKALRPREQVLIRMAKLEERPLAEEALKTGMSISAVKVSLHRAIKQLKKSAV